jgi:phosphohistidine phosphatase
MSAGKLPDMAERSDPATTGVRRLVLLRHAKSAWPDGVPDLQRPLNDRGRRDARAAGQWLRENVGGLDAVVCSPAQRTQETWALVTAELDDAPSVVLDDRVYAAEPEELLDVVRDLPDAAGTALLIGHNPGVLELVELLGGQEREMRTASIAVLSWPGTWADTAVDGARLDAHATPRG